MTEDKYLAMANLRDALDDALADGLDYGDICRTVADALNSFKKEQKNREQNRKN